MTGHKSRMERIIHNQDWLDVAAGLSSLCNGWAARRDLYVYLGRDGGEGTGAPAFYSPDSGSIEINSEKAFGQGSDGSRIGDITKRHELSKYPVAGGLSLHESGHARFSKADWAKVQKRFDDQKSAWDVFVMLEETRIEGRMVKLFPTDKGYLRASCKSIIMGGDPSEWRPRGIMLLVVGRGAVGALNPEDVAPVETWLLEQDGWMPHIILRGKEIIQEFVFLDDSGPDLDTMIRLAKELDDLMPKDPPGPGEEGEGEGGENGEGEGAGGSLPSVVADALDKAAREGRIEVIHEGDMAAAKEERQVREKQNAEHEANIEVAKDTFEDSAGENSSVPSQLRTRRQPSGDERAAAVRLARDLAKARYRDRDVIEYGTDVPPGRFNGAEAMRMHAARTKGGRTDIYHPFKAKKRLDHEDPPLTVGIMADVSGSMSASQPTVATATWVISDATYRVGNASSGMVYFGQDVYPGLRKGERLKDVRTWSGRDGWEQFDFAFRALDGELNLLNGKGARLLVVVSDGQYGADGQDTARDKWLKYCVNNGVGVVWLTPRENQVPTELTIPGMEIVSIGTGFLDATAVIGTACIRALERVSGK